EFGSVGPVPLAAMLLAEMGASVLRIDRPGNPDVGIKRPARFTPTHRSRDAIVLDVKNDAVRSRVLDLVCSSHVLLEGYRPGAMERLGLGPEDCLRVNPKLVYGRMTGWG